MSNETGERGTQAREVQGDHGTAGDLGTEFATYRRELPRLLEAGQAGRYALIRGDEVLTIWDTQRDALQGGCERFGLEPFAIHKIDPRDVERFALWDAQQEARCRT
jgi:hypothetical protein